MTTSPRSGDGHVADVALAPEAGPVEGTPAVSFRPRERDWTGATDDDLEDAVIDGDHNAAAEHWRRDVEDLRRQVNEQRLRAEAAERLLNTPEIFEFAKAVQLEAAHQRKRWGSDHDAGKTDADWLWLLGFLAGKALHNPAPHDQEGAVLFHVHEDPHTGEPLYFTPDGCEHDGCVERRAPPALAKQLHRIVTVAAAAANWHAAKLGQTNMRPGIASPAGEPR